MKFWSEHLKGRDHKEDLGVNEILVGNPGEKSPLKMPRRR
jgi:hypothetical protein